MLKAKSGRRIRINETPADFKLDNSKRSARLPKTITEASKTEMGRANGKSEIDL
jgi:hypothetical protein